MAEQLIKDIPIVPHTPAELERIPLVSNQRNLGWISDAIAGIVEGKTPKWWWAAFIPSFTLMVVCFGLNVSGSGRLPRRLCCAPRLILIGSSVMWRSTPPTRPLTTNCITPASGGLPPLLRVSSTS